MMDCKTALRWLEVCRPWATDLADSEFSIVAAHLEQCSECLSRFHARQAFDVRIAGAVQAVPVPAGLRERILARLEQKPIERRRRYLVRIAASAAAIILLAAGLWPWLHKGPSHAPIEAHRLAEFVVYAERQLDHVQDYPDAVRVPQRVHEWCAQELGAIRLSAVPPARCPIEGLAGIARARVTGYSVGVFRYHDPSGSATVFALPRHQFPITGLTMGYEQINQTRNPIVIAWVEGDTTYVAVLNGWVPKEWENLRNPLRSPEMT